MDGSEEIAAHWELRRLKDLGRCISCVCHTTREEGPGLPAGPDDVVHPFRTSNSPDTPCRGRSGGLNWSLGCESASVLWRYPVRSPIPRASVCLPSRRDPWTGATAPGPRRVITHTGLRHYWGVQRWGRYPTRSSALSCHDWSGCGPATHSRVPAYAIARARMSGGPRCASTLCVICAVQCGRKPCADHR